MAGARIGTVYLTDQGTTPVNPNPTHKTLFTNTAGVWVLDPAGVTHRLDNYDTIVDVSGALAAQISGAGAVTLLQGVVSVPINNNLVSISHATIPTSACYPVVTLLTPNTSSIIYPISISNRTTSGFDVVLGGAPDVVGYSVDWFMAAGGSTQTITSGGGGGGGSSTINVSGASTLVTGVTDLEFAGAAIQSVTNLGGGHAKVTIAGGGSSAPTIATGSGTTFSPDGLDDIYDYQLTASATINAPTSLGNGESIIFKLKQPVGGLASLILSNGGGLTWRMPNGVINLSTDTSEAVDMLTVVRIGNDLFVSIVKNLV